MIRIGEKLKEERKKRGLTLEQVAKATRIRVGFLQALENGEYDKLPGSSYAHGFVRNYLEFLGFPLKQYMALFRREYDENENRTVLPEGMIGQKGLSLERFSIRQIVWLGGVILLGLFIYLFFQYKPALLPPALFVTMPLEKAKVSSQTIQVTGTTDTNTEVTVDNLPAFVDANGHFTKDIPVFPGNVTLTVKAENSFGKVTTVERHITVMQ